MKKLSVFIILMGMGWSVFAQDAVQNNGPAPHLFQQIMTTTIFIIGGIIILSAILTLLRLSENMSKNIVNQYLSEQGRSVEVKTKTVVTEPKVSWLQRLTNAVPIEQQQDIVFDHAFDGIQELDNKLPPWWVGMFYITIIIGVVYFVYDIVLAGNGTAEDRYAQEMAEAEAAKTARLIALGGAIDESSVILTTDETAIAEGKEIFISKCAACHGAEGGSMPGGVGPNLTDDYWLHGGGVQNVFKTIKYGVPSKGMIAWANQITPLDIQNVASFIVSLKGTNPPNAKEPQGELYIAENIETTDSTTTEM